MKIQSKFGRAAAVVACWSLTAGVVLPLGATETVKPTAVNSTTNPATKPAPSVKIDAKVRTEAINTLAKKVRANYVFPELAEKIAAGLQASEKAGYFQKMDDAEAFAKALSEKLLELSNDKHFRAMYHTERVPEDTPADADIKPTPAEIAEQKANGRKFNFGVSKFEHLPGNIAVIDLRAFAGAEFGGDTLHAVMNLASGADALIFDLRKNGGGSPEMVALISSHLFDKPVHLNDLYYRFNNKTLQYWTSAHVPGQRYGQDKPVYVLTSKRTFSAAEEFSNNLKTLKRATIIGETTGGGANPGDMFKIAEHFSAFIPTGRAINPITKDNWEGKGVSPDVSVPAEQALLVAQLKAITPLIEKESNPRNKKRMQKAAQDWQQELDALKQPKKL